MAASSGVEGFMPPSGGTDFNDAPGRQDTTELTDAELKKIFHHFDSDGSGSIDNEELRSAMMALGIKVTISSAKKVLAQIDEDGNGTVEWDEFHKFFEKVKDKEEIKKMLSAANAKYMEYKAQVQGDPNFQSRFFVPNSFPKLIKFVGHNDNVEGLAFLNPKDPEFITVSLDGQILLWDVNGTRKTSKGKTPGYEVIATDQPGGCYGVDIINGGTSFVCCLGARDQPNAALYDISNLKGTSADSGKSSDVVKMRYQGPNFPLYSISVEKTRNPTNFFCGAKSGAVCYFDLTKPEPVCTLDDIHEGVVNSIDLHPDSRQVCSASTDGLVQILDMRAAGAWKSSITIEDAAASEVVHQALWRGEREIVSCGDDFCVKKWDLRKLKHGPVENYLGHTSPVRAVALSPCQKFCISSTNDGTVRVWVLDERNYMKDEYDMCNNKIEKMEMERRVIDKRIQMEEDDEDLDNVDFAAMEKKQEQQMKDDTTLKTKLVPELERNYKRSFYLGACQGERESMNCVQARYALEGHQLPTTALCWRDHPDDKNRAQVLSGAQDQTAGYYEVKKPSIKSFHKWGVGEGEGSGSP